MIIHSVKGLMQRFLRKEHPQNKIAASGLIVNIGISKDDFVRRRKIRPLPSPH